MSQCHLMGKEAICVTLFTSTRHTEKTIPSGGGGMMLKTHQAEFSTSTALFFFPGPHCSLWIGISVFWTSATIWGTVWGLFLQLSDKQFTWVAINARARYNRWNEIEDLFRVKVRDHSSRSCTSTPLLGSTSFENKISWAHNFPARMLVLCASDTCV